MKKMGTTARVVVGPTQRVSSPGVASFSSSLDQIRRRTTKESASRGGGRDQQAMPFRSLAETVLSSIVTVQPHEIPLLIRSASCFFFVLSAYFVVLPLRDDGAISLGLNNLPGLFVGSLVLTLVAAPVSTLIFSLPNLPKGKALVFVHRFFGVSLCAFFFLWYASVNRDLPFMSKVSFGDREGVIGREKNVHDGWDNHGWFYILVRIAFFLWVALLNLVSISATWTRIIDVMDNESGSRLFGVVGAGATLGQLFGSLCATSLAWLGPYLLLCAALLMELAAQAAKGINYDIHPDAEELVPIRNDFKTKEVLDGENDQHTSISNVNFSPEVPMQKTKPQCCIMLDGFWLILSSTYLLLVSLFLWLSAVVSSFFYFQKVTIIATSISSPFGRRKMFAEINSFIALFILVGQLTLTGHILTTAGVTVAILSSPLVAFFNVIALVWWPTWITVAISETLRKVVTYVVARPGRELLFTVVSQEEKYKAKVCIDVIVQRLGDAAAATIYKLLFAREDKWSSVLSLYALPLCLLWMATAIHLGKCHANLARPQNGSLS